MSHDEVLGNIYFNVNNAACFASVHNLYKEAKKVLPDLSKSDVRKWLEKQESYCLHKMNRKRYTRNPIIVDDIDSLWEIDLADLSMLKKQNKQYRYLLQVIDILSKFAFSIPIKKKDPTTVAGAFEKILKKSNRKPVTVASDAGKEFVGKPFKTMLQKYGIRSFVSTSDQKCPTIERWNRTLKTRMWRYFTHKNTHRYLDVLQKLVDAYNSSRHRTIGCRPIDVTPENAHIFVEKLRAKAKRPEELKFRYNIGDKVRISKQKGIFEKGYFANYSREIFTVVSRSARPLPIYKLEDLNSEKIAGVFYETELQKAHLPDTYKIEKILRWRKSGSKKQALVRFLGYGPDFDQWVNKEYLVDL